MSDPTLLDKIEQLTQAQPLNPESVGKILGIRVVRNKAADSAAVQAYSAKSADYQTIDLRMPDNDIGDGTVFLSVTLKPDNGLDQAAICARFGTDFHSEIPSPRYQPGAVPVYLVFEQDWGSLSFGVSADSQRRMVRFILNMRSA